MAKERANGEGNIRKRKDGHREGLHRRVRFQNRQADYQEYTGKSHAKVKEKLNAALKQAVKEQLIPGNPTEGCIAPNPNKAGLLALRWDNMDIQNKIVSGSKQYVRKPDGSLELPRSKTGNFLQLVSIPQTAVDLLIQELDKHSDNPYLFPSPITGEIYHLGFVVNLHKKS